MLQAARLLVLSSDVMIRTLFLRRNKNAGFTLIELLIVIVLIGILAGIAMIRYGPTQESAKSAEAFSILSEIASAENRYYLENSAYTSTISDLDSFSADPVSTHFTFSVDTGNKYSKAAAKVGQAQNDYYMCIESGKTSTGSAPTCP